MEPTQNCEVLLQKTTYNSEKSNQDYRKILLADLIHTYRSSWVYMRIRVLMMSCGIELVDMSW